MDDEAVQRQIEAALGSYRTPGRKRDLSGENALIAKISPHTERHDCNLSPQFGSLIEHQHARDTVLFCARQDAAHAVLNTASILEEIASLRRYVRVLFVLTALGWLVVLGLCSLLLALVVHGIA